MIDLLWFTAVVSGLNLAGTVALLTMALLRPLDPGPRDPRPRVPDGEEVH